MGTGWSRPSAWRRRWICSGVLILPSSKAVGSAGTRCEMLKVGRLTPSTTKTRNPSRRTIKTVIGGAPDQGWRPCRSRAAEPELAWVHVIDGPVLLRVDEVVGVTLHVF